MSNYNSDLGNLSMENFKVNNKNWNKMNVAPWMNNKINNKINNKVNRTNFKNVNKNTSLNLNSIKETVSNKITNAKNTYNGMDTKTKIFLFIGIIIILFIIGFIFRYYRNQQIQENFSRNPIFMTEIENNNPHNTKKIYRFTDPNTGRITPFIPNHFFNERNGTQYTFSFWMFIDAKEWNYRFGEWKHIFHRGSAPLEQIESGSGGSEASDNADIDQTPISKLNMQRPGIWLSPKENRLNCIMTTTKGEERLTLNDIELNQWINITLIVNNTNMALYRNGLLEKTINLFGRITSINEAVYINYFGGFAGNMAFLQFFDTALTPLQVREIYNKYLPQINLYKTFVANREISRIRGGGGNGHDNHSNNKAACDDKCNYLQYVRDEKDKEKLIQKITSNYRILCMNMEITTEMDKNELCDFEINMYTQKLNKMDVKRLKIELQNMIKGIVPVNPKIAGKYYFNGIDSKRCVSNGNPCMTDLSDAELKQIQLTIRK